MEPAEGAQENAELALLLDVAHEVQNVQAGFKGAVKRTFVLSPGISACFAVRIGAESADLFVPREMFGYFEGLRWRHAAVLPGKPGLFLVFRFKGQECALRIFVRAARTSLVAQFEKLRVRCVPRRGEEPGPGFELALKSVESLEWEKE